MLQRWQDEGGVMIIGYEMYRNLAQGRNVKSRKLKEIFNKALVDPGKWKINANMHFVYCVFRVFGVYELSKHVLYT